ncbi:hypothetical protein AeMF1_018942 [Aphanomyces euteiches]|nr:hypothetical protein AeMF1_018942 [Aphanomyces euteiches]
MVNWLIRQRPGIPGRLRWDARCSLSTFESDASPLEARQKRELTLLVDGNNMLYEAYDPRCTVAWNNQQVGTAMRFVQRLHEILRAKNATRFAVFFDTPHVTKRQLGNAQYKPKHRKRMMPHALRAQFPVTKSVLEQLGIPVITLQVPGVEADDLIASYTKESIDEGFDVIIVTNDTDMYQLVKTIGTGDDGTDQSVVVYQPFRGRTIPERRVIKLLHGARPDQQPEIRALCGDPRGKTPGIPGGVSTQVAIQLLKQHGNLPSLLRNLDEALLATQELQLILIEQSYRSSVLNCAVPLPIPTEQLSISQPFQFDHNVLLQFFGRDGAEEVVALKEKTKEAKVIPSI